MKKKPKLYRPEKQYRADYVYWVWFGVATIIAYGAIFLMSLSISQDKGSAFFNAVIAVATIAYVFISILQYFCFRDSYQPVIEPTFVITAEYCFLTLKILKTSFPFVLYAVKIEPSDLFEDGFNQERVIYKNIPFIQTGNKEITHNIPLPPLKGEVEAEGAVKLVLYTSLRKAPYDLYVVPSYKQVGQMRRN